MNWATTSGCSECYIILWAFVSGNFSHCTGQGEHLGSGGYNKFDSRVSKIYQRSHFATCYLVRPKIAFAYPLFFFFLDYFRHDFHSSHGGNNSPGSNVHGCEGTGLMSYGSKKDTWKPSARPNAWSTCSNNDFSNWWRTKGHKCLKSGAPPSTGGKSKPTGSGGGWLFCQLCTSIKVQQSQGPSFRVQIRARVLRGRR